MKLELRGITKRFPSVIANQGVNLLYVIYGGGAVAYKMAATDDIDAEQRRFPHCRFLGLALLDAFGTFFTAMGARPEAREQLAKSRNKYLSVLQH